jgi:hypothetical protein
MHIKPKDIRVTLPIVLTFDTADEIPAFAASVNTIIHGKVKMKCEELGALDSKHIGMFYLQRNGEYQALRDSWMNLIETEEMNAALNKTYPHPAPKTLEEFADNDLFRHLDVVAGEDPKEAGTYRLHNDD